MSYKSKFRRALREYRPSVEKLTQTKLGNIVIIPRLIPGYESHRSRKEGITFAEISWEEEPEIFLNSSRLLDFIPYSTVSKIAIHEMAHLAHRQIRGMDFVFGDRTYHECVADYVVCKLTKPDDFATKFLFGDILNKNSSVVEMVLREENLSLREYMENGGPLIKLN